MYVDNQTVSVLEFKQVFFEKSKKDLSFFVDNIYLFLQRKCIFFLFEFIFVFLFCDAHGGFAKSVHFEIFDTTHNKNFKINLLLY